MMSGTMPVVGTQLESRRTMYATCILTSFKTDRELVRNAEWR